MELNKTFIDGLWSKEINVSDFVSVNIAPYTGDASFLQGPTERTKRIWEICLKALEEERNNNGVRSLDNVTVSTITSHKAGYIDKENELIVGLQTDELLKRAIKPFGGINVVAKACRENGLEVDEKVKPGKGDQGSQDEGGNADSSAVSENGRGGCKGSIGMAGEKGKIRRRRDEKLDRRIDGKGAQSRHQRL